MKLPPKVFNQLVDGLSLLSAMSFEGRPAASNLATVAKAWEVAFCSRLKLSDDDAGRVQAAFIRASGQLKKWPAPAEVIDLLPPNKSRLGLPPVKRETVPMPADFAELVKKMCGAEK